MPLDTEHEAPAVPSIASMTPSAACATARISGPRRPIAWWWYELTASAPSSSPAMRQPRSTRIAWRSSAQRASGGEPVAGVGDAVADERGHVLDQAPATRDGQHLRAPADAEDGPAIGEGLTREPEIGHVGPGGRRDGQRVRIRPRSARDRRPGRPSAGCRRAARMPPASSPGPRMAGRSRGCLRRPRSPRARAARPAAVASPPARA